MWSKPPVFPRWQSCCRMASGRRFRLPDGSAGHEWFAGIRPPADDTPSPRSASATHVLQPSVEARDFMARSGSGVGTGTGATIPDTGPHAEVTHSVSNGCRSNAASVLTRSLERLGYDPDRIRVSDRDPQRQSVAILERDRQVVVTLDGARVTISSAEGPGASNKVERAPSARSADPVTVLHQSLISAGIRPGALRSETKFTAA